MQNETDNTQQQPTRGSESSGPMGCDGISLCENCLHGGDENIARGIWCYLKHEYHDYRKHCDDFEHIDGEE